MAEKVCKSIVLANDKELVYTIDEPVGKKCIGDILLTPAFGVTAKRMLALSYFLTQNNFRVFRVDFRNHVGDSSGEIADARLSLQVEDILTMVNELGCRTIVSLSLSSRTVLRVCASSRKKLNAVFIAPVVNVRSTLECAGEEDLFGLYFDGHTGVEVLGYYIKNDFVKDCLDHNFQNCEDALKDLSSIKGTLTFIAGKSDPWVAFEEVEMLVNKAAKLGKDARLIPIEAASHKIDRNPAVALTYFEATTRECLRISGLDPDTIVIPNFRDIIQVASES